MNIDMIFYLSYGIFAFIATYLHPFFFSYHLVELIVRYPTMINIIKSFWQPKLSIFLTLVLILMANYFFSIIGYISVH